MINDEQEIRQLVATWMAATKAGEIETVLGLMADDVVFLLPGRPPMIGKSTFAAAAPAKRHRNESSSTARARFRNSATGLLCGPN